MTIIGGVDIETTGIDWDKGHRIIEFAISLYELETKRKLGSFETRVNPERPIDPKAQAVHGISFEDLADKPLWPEVAPKVSKLLSKCNYLVMHNGEGFDAPFIFHELFRAGVPIPPMFVVDTMLRGRWATPDGAVPNLQALSFACGVPYDKEKAHGALYDVDVMMDCFFSQFDAGFFPLPTAELAVRATRSATA
jgi:DNA polymerase-3 subunit epsilon